MVRCCMFYCVGTMQLLMCSGESTALGSLMTTIGEAQVQSKMAKLKEAEANSTLDRPNLMTRLNVSKEGCTFIDNQWVPTSLREKKCLPDSVGTSVPHGSRGQCLDHSAMVLRTCRFSGLDTSSRESLGQCTSVHGHWGRSWTWQFNARVAWRPLPACQRWSSARLSAVFASIA